MNILNVAHVINPLIGGGTASRTLKMSEFFLLRKKQCCILTLNIGLNSNIYKKIGKNHIISLPVLSERYFIPAINFFTLFDLIKKSDVIHLTGYWSVLNILISLIARFFNKPYILCPAGSFLVFGRSKYMKFIFHRLFGMSMLRNAARVIAITKKEKEELISSGLSNKLIEVIPNGVDLRDFPLMRKDFFYKKFKVPNKNFLLFVGRLNYIKGADILLEAFISVTNDLKDLQLIFIGIDEGLKETLRNKIISSDIKKNVLFIEPLEAIDLASAYRSASLLIVPSRQEAMSIVALEAGICGTLALVTNNCGFDEIKKINSNLVVKANPESLANSIRYLMMNNLKRKKIALKYSKFVSQNYNWDLIAGKYIALYEKILKNKIKITSC